MKFRKTDIEDLMVIEPDVFKDGRGHFFESYNNDIFTQNNIPLEFVQDNQSLSQKGVLRGLHFQNPPYQQGKIIRIVSGAVLDVAVDIRKKSPTYGKWSSVVLSAENNLMYWVPPGFAHGFLALEDNTILTYKCTALYNKQSEGAIRWNDTDLGIEWGISDPIINEKDNDAQFFKDFTSMF